MPDLRRQTTDILALHALTIEMATPAVAWGWAMVDGERYSDGIWALTALTPPYHWSEVSDLVAGREATVRVVGAPSGARVVLGRSFRVGLAEPERLHEHRDVLADDLLLQRDGVGCDDHSLAKVDAALNRRQEIGVALADARARLGEQAPALVHRPRDRRGHLGLLRASLEALAQHPRDGPVVRECIRRRQHV